MRSEPRSYSQRELPPPPLRPPPSRPPLPLSLPIPPPTPRPPPVPPLPRHTSSHRDLPRAHAQRRLRSRVEQRARLRPVAAAPQDRAAAHTRAARLRMHRGYYCCCCCCCCNQRRCHCSAGQHVLGQDGTTEPSAGMHGAARPRWRLSSRRAHRRATLRRLPVSCPSTCAHAKCRHVSGVGYGRRNFVPCTRAAKCAQFKMLYCTAIVDFDFRFCDASSHEAEQGRGTDEEQQPPAPLDRFRSVPFCALQRRTHTRKLHDRGEASLVGFLQDEDARPESFRADLFVRDAGSFFLGGMGGRSRELSAGGR